MVEDEMSQVGGWPLCAVGCVCPPHPSPAADGELGSAESHSDSGNTRRVLLVMLSLCLKNRRP